VTARFIGKAQAWWPTAFAFVIASSSTANADPRTVANIPTPPQQFAAAEPKATQEGAPSTEELPPPYEAWQGTGPEPPTARPARDLPLPFARPREIPRRPLELTLSLAVFLPSCGSGSVDDRGCLTVTRGSGLDAALLYRVAPFFAVGVEGAVSGFATRGEGALSGAGGGARFFGVVGRVYFAEQGVWDPYLALTLGAGSLRLAGAGGTRVSTTGLGGRVAGGIDFALGSHFRLGPSASFAHWVAWSEEQCSASVCRDQPAAYGRLLGFATLGFRLTGSFGDVL